MQNPGELESHNSKFIHFAGLAESSLKLNSYTKGKQQISAEFKYLFWKVCMFLIAAEGTVALLVQCEAEICSLSCINLHILKKICTVFKWNLSQVTWFELFIKEVVKSN